MVDKLRKFGELLWLNKERLILVAMVAILCYQVYKVVYPDERPRGTVPMPPKSAESVTQPPVSPDKPGPTLPPDVLTLTRRNPFWFHSGTTTNTKQGNEDPGIKLLDIQGNRAQLQTATTTKWYTEGMAFEQYRLESVDATAGTATVYVEGLGRDVTLQKE